MTVGNQGVLERQLGTYHERCGTCNRGIRSVVQILLWHGELRRVLWYTGARACGPINTSSWMATEER